MPSKKLLEVIQLLGARQRKRLQDFVRSPYFNQAYNAESLVELLDLIILHNADSTHPNLQKEYLNQYYFPNRSFQEKHKNPIDTMSSALYKLVRQFIVQEEMKVERQKEEPLALARFFLAHSMEDRFWQTIKRFRRSWEVEQPHSTFDYHLRLLVEGEVAAFHNRFNTYADDSHLNSLNICLDQYFAVKKMELANFLLFQSKIGPTPIGATKILTDALMDVFPHYEEIHEPLSLIYHVMYRLLEQDDDAELITEFHRLLDEYKEVIPTLEYRNFMAFYRYFLGLQYRREGAPDILPKLFELYKSHIELGFFEVDDKILPASLKLMVNIAIRLDETKWAHQLLKQYPASRITGTRFPKEFHNLCQADIFFAEGAYNQAHQYLEYRNFEDVNCSIQADVLLIKIYFKTDDQLLESRVRALELKVRRARLKDLDKKSYLEFLRAMRKLIKWRWVKAKEKLQKLAGELKQSSNVVERTWLLKVLDAEIE